MKRVTPLLVAAATFIALGGGSWAQDETSGAKPTVAIGPFTTENPSIEYQAVALALEDSLAMKLRYSRLCYTVDLSDFRERARTKSLPLGSPEDVRTAMVQLDIPCALIGTVSNQGGPVDASITLLKLKDGQTSAVTTFRVPGSTSDLIGLFDAAVLQVAKELLLVDTDGAFDRMRQADLSDSQGALMAYYTGKALLQGRSIEQCDQAAAKYQEALNIDGKFREARAGLGEVRVRKAELLKAQGDVDGCLQELGGASLAFAEIGESRAYARAQARAAETYAGKGDSANEVKCYHNAIRALLANGSPEALLEALSAIDKIRADRMAPESWFLLGQIYALKAPRVPRDLKPEDGANPPVVKERTDYLGRAAGYLEKALELDPQNVQFLIEIGRFYRLSDELPDSLSKSSNLLIKATALAPDSFEAWFELGETYVKLKSWDQAQSAYQRAAQYVPEDRPALKSRVLEGVGRSHYELGKPDEAILVLQRSIELEPANINAAVLLVMCYIQKGDPDGAEQELEKALDRFPGMYAPFELLRLRDVIEQLRKRAVDKMEAPQPHRNPDPRDKDWGGNYEKGGEPRKPGTGTGIGRPSR